jgi:2-dehydropantoate 2-reductase
MLKIVIVGSGAIGSLFGYYLASGGHDVWMVDKDKKLVDAIRKKGICKVDGAKKACVKVEATLDPKEIKSCDIVLLCVKSFSTTEAVKGISHLIKGDVPLLTFQSGLGNIEAASSIIPQKNILGGVTFHGATLLGPGRVIYAGHGDTYIGEIDGKETERVQTIAKAFKESGIEAEISHNITGHIWSKAIIYSGINPLTAILRLKNGQLLDREESVSLLKVIINEGMDVAMACGESLVYDDPFEVLFSICKETSENLSPMLQDILGSRKTEIDALNGAIAQRGDKCKIKAPVNTALSDIIKVMEKGV